MAGPRRLAAAAAVLLVTTACAAPGTESVRLHFGHGYDPAAPHHACGAELMPEWIADVDAGLEMTVYPAGQLGNEQQMLEQLAGGNLEMSIAGPAFLGVWHEPVEVLDAAYAFTDVDHWQTTVEGDIGRELWEGLVEESGLRVLGSWYYGLRHTTANHPVREPGDLAGVKLRVPEAPIYLANTEAMGGEATPMAFGEVYMGLAQGIIDAQENPISAIAAMNFNEVQNVLSLTGHIVQMVAVVIAEPAWESLSSEQQEVLETAVTDAGQSVLECVLEEEEEYLEEWAETGELEIVDDVDVATFRQRATELLPERFPWGDLYRTIQDEGDADV